MTREELAVQLFDQGFSCSQAVAAAGARDFGVDSETVLRLAGALGGGIARSGQTCGAVTGALMVIGLKHGKVDAEDQTAKDETYRMSGRFMEQFAARYGSTQCKELLGCDLSTPEGRQQVRERHLHAKFCKPCVCGALKLLAEQGILPSE